MKSPIFIVGIPRSGSTLWHNTIVSGGGLLRLGEMRLLNPWRRDFGDFIRKNKKELYDKKKLESMVDIMFSGKHVSGLTGSFWSYDITKINDFEIKQKISNQVYNSDRSIESIVKIIIENVVSYHGADRCCIKFPVNIKYVDSLIEWYPDCKIIHVVRDPRANCLSKTNDPGGTAQIVEKYPAIAPLIRKATMFFTLAQYCWSSKFHLRYKSYDNYALFKYEDLLTDTEKTLKALCAFVGIDYVSTMLAPKAGQRSSLTGLSKGRVDKAAGTRWENRISAFDKFIITRIARESMGRFGFDPESHPIYKS